MRVSPSSDDVAAFTPLWEEGRFSDGRPNVPDAVLATLRDATTEQAWSILRDHGFDRQFAGDWMETHPGRVIVGRAVTAQFLPHRPDLDEVIVRAGAAEGHLDGAKQNSWIIELLRPGDIMVVDIFGKVAEGTVVGDNLATAVASRTGVGAVINGGVRDLQGIRELQGVNFFVRGVDPTPIRHVTLAGINIPIRIGSATVLPGDIVIGTPTGVIFVPPHLAGLVASRSHEIRLRDVFGKIRLADRTYTTADIDVAAWQSHIEDDFRSWRQLRGDSADAPATTEQAHLGEDMST